MGAMDKEEADVRRTAAVRMLEKAAATYASHPVDFVAYLRTVQQKYPDVAIVAEIKSLVDSSERHEEALGKVRSLLKSASEVTERLRVEVNATTERALAERRRRRRLQIEIRPTEEHIVARLMEAFSTNESDAGRQMLQIVGRLDRSRRPWFHNRGPPRDRRDCCRCATRPHPRDASRRLPIPPSR